MASLDVIASHGNFVPSIDDPIIPRNKTYILHDNLVRYFNIVQDGQSS